MKKFPNPTVHTANACIMVSNPDHSHRIVPCIDIAEGVSMPVIGLGTWALRGETCVNAIQSALSLGVRRIDTAHMYENEREVGRAVRSCGLPRKDVFITTKLYPYQFARPEAAIEEALETLDTGYIDMMMLHHPGAGDIAAYRVMERYVAKGLIRTLGVSCFYIDEIDRFLPQVSIKPSLVQNEIHPYYQDRKVTRHLQSLGLVVEAWYPLGGRGFQREMMCDPVLVEIAAAHGRTVAQVMLRWNLQCGVCVIPGSSNPKHILENISVFDFELTDDEMRRMAALDRAQKHDWY